VVIGNKQERRRGSRKPFNKRWLGYRRSMIKTISTHQVDINIIADNAAQKASHRFNENNQPAAF
jgi:hypothetical protein